MSKKRLYIFDANELPTGFFGRTEIGDDDVALPIKVDVAELEGTLDKFIAAGTTFGSILFRTHGSPGTIYFGNKNPLSKITIKRWDQQKNYHRLLPQYAYITFDGCNAAEGQEGWDFLESVGRFFLRSAGGEVDGFATYGLSIRNPMPGIGGTTVHPTGGHRTMWFAAGGKPVKLEGIGVVDITDYWEYHDTVRPLPHGTLAVKIPPQSYDNVLIPMLAKPVMATDVKGQAARANAVETFFRKMERADAQFTLGRLQARRHDDKLAKAFYYYLSTPTRIKLLMILKDRT